MKTNITLNHSENVFLGWFLFKCKYCSQTYWSDIV